jgi:hypothetical protein
MGAPIPFIGIPPMELIPFIGDMEFIEFILACMLPGCIPIPGVIPRLVIPGGVIVPAMPPMLGGE